MRPIKYRAFDKRVNIFHYWDCATQPFDNVFWYIVKQQKLTPDEYTGLKDKNGKEIYEGDIVSFDYSNHVVEYGVQCVDAFEGVGFNLWEFYGEYEDKGKAIRLQESIEVIGNIYENPELCN